MPVYELRSDSEQVRFIPGGDDTVTVFTYDITDGTSPNQTGKNRTMPLKVARSYWHGLRSLGYREVK